MASANIITRWNLLVHCILNSFGPQQRLLFHRGVLKNVENMSGAENPKQINSVLECWGMKEETNSIESQRVVHNIWNIMTHSTAPHDDYTDHIRYDLGIVRAFSSDFLIPLFCCLLEHLIGKMNSWKKNHISINFQLRFKRIFVKRSHKFFLIS